MGLILALSACAGRPATEGEGGALIVQRNPDGTIEITPDPVARDRQDWLERRRQDEQIRREIYNWVPRPRQGEPATGDG